MRLSQKTLSNGPFIFTITDLARFLGKSPVTLRGWERKGLLDLPRVGDDRKLTAAEVREVAHIAKTAGRISKSRLDLIGAAVTLITIIEQENK